MACDTIIAVSGMEFEANLVKGDGIKTVYGLDPVKLAAGIEKAIAEGVKGLVSFGTAAGLSPALVPGSIVIARHVWSQEQLFTADAAWAEALAQKLPDAHIATLAGVEKPLVTLEDKSDLYRKSGAIAADMESQQVAHIALRHNLPFAVLRVVLDDADCILPLAALAATNMDGTLNYAGLVRSLITQPKQLGALIRLGGKQAKAKKALLRCGQLLRGSLLGMNFR